MAKKADIEVIYPGKDGGDTLVRVTVSDSDLYGKQAILKFETEVNVKDDKPVNLQKLLYEHPFTIRAGQAVYEIRLPHKKLPKFTYSGRQIDILLRTTLVVDDGLIFDTKIGETHQLPILDKPKVKNDAGAMIEPEDLFNFFANLKAIPFQNQVITLVLVVLGGLVMLVNAVIGVHDQFVPEAATWLYSHYSSDGDSSSPLAAALTGSGVLGAGIWFLMKSQLRKYMKFHFNKLPDRIRPGLDYPADRFFSGKSRVPLKDITLRIVASNMERGQYRRQRGSKTVTVSFKEPVRGVKLFEKTVKHIPANSPISDWFAGDSIRFDDMFHVLYPPNMISETHGLDVHWEIQLLHPEFVDHELAGPQGKFKYEDFLGDGSGDDDPADNEEKTKSGLTFEL
jgi:hypothetical protein